MIELCLVIMALSVLYVLCVPFHTYSEDEYDTFPQSYLLKQSSAIASSASRILDEYDTPVITFNAKGNVQRAMTLHLGRKGRTIVVELGGGRLVFR